LYCYSTMEATNTISVSEVCGTKLITREAAVDLINSIDFSPCTMCNVFELDFSSVEFMSRSFADQLHKEKLRVHRDTRSEIIITNASREVADMLNSVAKTQSATIRTKEDIPVFRFSDAKVLTEYLLSL